MTVMIFFRLTRWIVLPIIICLGICGPVGGETDNGAIKVGATVSLTGKYQATSAMMRGAYELWARRVNAKGGLLGRPVELILYNDESSREVCVALYEKLVVEDRVDILLAPYGSTLTLAVAKVAEKHGHFLLASAASSNEIWKQDFKNVFGVYAPASRYFIGFMDLIARHGFTSVAIFHEQNTFNIEAARGAAQWAERFGIRVGSMEAVESEEQFYEIIESVKQNKGDAVIFCGYPPNVYRFMEHLEKESLRLPALAFTVAPALPDFLEKAGTFGDGVFGPSQWEADERLPFPGTIGFIEDFKKFTGTSPSYHAGSAYAACQLLERAATETKSLETEKIGNFIRALDTVTVIGRFKVDSSGLQVGHNPILIQWQNGKKEIVYPTKMRTSAPRFITK